jgi:hypothetical protein
VIFFLALATYAASHYVTYLAALQAEGLTRDDVSFISYIQFVAESMTYSIRGGSEEGVEVGKLGYLFLGIEGLGFAAGTFLPLFILSKTAYCPVCQLYMKKTVTANFPSASTYDVFKKTPRKEKAAYLSQAIAEANAKHQELVRALEGKSIGEIRPFLEPNKTKAGQMLAYAQFTLHECPTGDSAVIKSSVVHQGLDGKLHSQNMPEIKKGQPSMAVPG